MKTLSKALDLSALEHITVIAALLHDIGKSNLAFQDRLKNKQGGGDYYRHEWLSLKLFTAMIAGCRTDKEWLSKFAANAVNPDCFDDSRLTAYIANDIEQGSFEQANLHSLPPLAQWVAWLIVTHHRLPPTTATQNDIKKRKAKLLRAYEINRLNAGVSELYTALKSFDYWQKNPVVLEKDAKRASNAMAFNNLTTKSIPWQEHLSKAAAGSLCNPNLFNAAGDSLITDTVDDHYLLYLSRLSLILADHNYSSLALDDKRRMDSDSRYTGVYANSNPSDGSIRQSLDEHNIGVSRFAGELIDSLPTTLANLPALVNHRALSDDTATDKYKWQNQAAAGATQLRDHSRSHGFFGVNLASTGCGKTIGNARIMNALADADTGARFTVALGLRVLTLQTGQQFRANLSLDSSQVAIAVGGEAVRELYEMGLDDDESTSDAPIDDLDVSTIGGSQSASSLYSGEIDSDFAQDYVGMDTVLTNDKSRSMLLSPILVCTIDHLMQVCECINGGAHILPALRLLSSDLILDEPDDFGVEDMHALSRLVYMSGLLGSRVLLSSATLTPSIVKFLFDAYWRGRNDYNTNNGLPTGTALKPACLFVDEQVTSTHCVGQHAINAPYDAYISDRATYLSGLPARRQAEIIDINTDYDREFPEDFFESLSQTIMNNAYSLHLKYHDVSPACYKKASVGLVRLSHTKSLVAIVEQVSQSVEVPANTHIHFCCYHSKQVLALRSSLEKKLDEVLDRKDATKNLFDSRYISDAIDQSAAENHIFIVFATPISEVGRDHDYDWSIVEPSSMRSIIQLAGRVWRHRGAKMCDQGCNIGILQYNLKYFTRTNNSQFKQLVFSRPGFETIDSGVSSYDLNNLIDAGTLSRIDSIPRLIEPVLSSHQVSLAGVEHQCLSDVLSDDICLANSVYHDQSAMYFISSDIQKLTPFRESDQVEVEYTIKPGSDGSIDFYLTKDIQGKEFGECSKQNHILSYCDFETQDMVDCWLVGSIQDELLVLQDKKPGYGADRILRTYFTVSLKESLFNYSPFLGFYE